MHLTKAMGLVASSKIRRAGEAMKYSKEYESAISDLLSQLFSSDVGKKNEYTELREDGDCALIVIAGDRGLAGGYNANVFRTARELPKAMITPIGKRACDKFKGELRYAEGFEYSEAKKLAEKFCEDFRSGKINKLGIVYTEYISMMSQQAVVKWLLPIVPTLSPKHTDITFEPDAATVLQKAIPEYIAGIIYACVKESFASEVAARRVAMDSAGKNAQEMIDRLGLEYNRARQGAITQEITEIVAGSGN